MTGRYDLRAEQPIEVLLLPGTGPIVVGELALLLEERGGVEATAAVLALDLVLAVQHLVKDDPGHEVVGDAGLVERRVDADDAILDGEAPHLDRPAALPLRGDRPPGDARVERAAEPLAVQAVEDRLQVVEAPGCPDGEVARPAFLLP